MFEHVYAQSTAQKGWLEYAGMKEGKRAPDCCRVVCRSVCMHVRWHDNLVSSCWTTGPSLKAPHLLPQMCSPCPRSHCWGQEGGITPGMILYYRAGLPFRLGLVLLAGSGLILLPVLPPLSWSLWYPHTLTTRLQQFTFSTFWKKKRKILRIVLDLVKKKKKGDVLRGCNSCGHNVRNSSILGGKKHNWCEKNLVGGNRIAKSS